MCREPVRKPQEGSGPERIFDLGFAGRIGVHQSDIVKSLQTGILCLAHLCLVHSRSCVKYTISLGKSKVGEERKNLEVIKLEPQRNGVRQAQGWRRGFP